MPSSDKIVVEITKTEAPVKLPTYEWWICWRDKPDDKDFKCLTVDSMEQVSREVDRIACELAGREIWVSVLAGSYVSKITVTSLPTSLPSEIIKRECVN